MTVQTIAPMRSAPRITRDDIIGIDQQVPLLDGTFRTYAYLDNAASTPALRRVQDTVNEFLLWYSSVHRGAGFKSLLSTRAYKQAREIVTQFLGADPEHDAVIFGKNTTEAINTLAHHMGFTRNDVVVCTMMEHHSNDLPWRQTGAQVVHVGVHADGSLDLDELASQLKRHAGRVKLLATTGASNVSGWVPPVHDIAEMAHAYGAQILVDCAQLAPHRAVDMGPVDSPRHLDFVTISAHKMYAPFGTGALVGPKVFFQDSPPPIQGGGTIEVVTLNEVHWADAPERDEAGSPNVVGAVALAASMRALTEMGMETLAAHEAELTRHALEGLNRIPGIRIYGSADPQRVADRLGVISFDFAGMPHAKLAAILGFEGGIGVRNGCFCAHPYILRLLDISDAQFETHKHLVLRGDRSQIPGLVRASFGCYNTLEEIDRLVETVARAATGDYQGDYVIDRPSGNYYPLGLDPAFTDPYFSLYS